MRRLTAVGASVRLALFRRGKERPVLASSKQTAAARRCRRKFLGYFPDGYHDSDYLDLERGYKVETHQRWEDALGLREFRTLIRAGAWQEIAARAIRVEQRSRHSMIFSFEKMALRDAVRTPASARDFARGLFDLLHGRGPLSRRFERWIGVVTALPRRQTRVLTWPLLTVFGFIAQPDRHVFLKPTVTRRAALAYGFEFRYSSRPSWPVYEALLQFAGRVRRDTADLGPRDMIDAQSFIWIQGSDEYT
jgi:hypothetical protein